MKRVILILMLLGTVGLALHAQHPALIPQPLQTEWGTGSFRVDHRVSISCESASLRPAAEYLSTLIERATGIRPRLKKGNGDIRLRLVGDPMLAHSYHLSVAPKAVVIVGGDYQAIVNAISTLRQLMPEQGATAIPCVKISDRPRFQWRGMELDCSRHFFTVAEVKELLDVLALYKINKFHWHLTDDQGWRIEIKKYPKLTLRGGYRTLNNQDSVCLRRAVAEDNPDFLLPADRYAPATAAQTAESGSQYGGFYTQDDIRDIVAYARQRGIDIVPEIDIPGHSLCAINNYEGLSCFEQTGWGKLFTTPLCPGKDAVLEFCKDVYQEVFELFPYEYVHLGGDEVDMTNWRRCPDCQQRMRDHHLATEAQLQSWFLHQMEAFCNAHGRHIIGWDEIIAGGLSATSTIMWWRSWNRTALDDATAHGNPVICTPNSPFYLDYDQGKKTLQEIYDYDARPARLSESQANLVLGVQGNLWTEWVPTRERMYFMAFPRMLAVAELGWTALKNKSFERFEQHLLPHYERLRQLGVTYRRPDLEGFFSTNVFTDSARVDIRCADPSAVIRYTTDGTLPQPSSALYTQPFSIAESTDFRFRIFSPDGRKGQTASALYRKEAYAEAFCQPLTEVGNGADGTAADAQNDSHARPGLCCEWYDYDGPRCADIDKAPLLGTFTLDRVTIPAECHDNIGLIISGFIEVPADGIYTFALLSDDGSYLMLDGQMVVDNDGEHSPAEVIGQHAMRRGLHPLLVRYFDHNGGTLQLRVLDSKGQPTTVRYWQSL